MSNAVFPITLPGILFDATVSPRFSTKIQQAVSGRETRAAFMAYPLWDVTLAFEFLRDGKWTATSELNTVAGFFLQTKGSWDSFLIAIPGDNTVSAMQFGTGTGAQTAFQLTRARGAGGFGFTEPVQNVNAITSLTVNGVAKVQGTDYTLSSMGLVTFAAAPASGAVLAWSGSFYYRCRFMQDSADFERFMQDLWALKKIQMTGAPGNKV
jgi:uncharacterized protein (TIGR02217 family)